MAEMKKFIGAEDYLAACQTEVITPGSTVVVFRDEAGAQYTVGPATGYELTKVAGAFGDKRPRDPTELLGTDGEVTLLDKAKPKTAETPKKDDDRGTGRRYRGPGGSTGHYWGSGRRRW